MSPQSEYHVRAVHCEHRASDDEVYAALKRATDPLDQAWDKLKKAQRITIKFNQAWEPGKQVYMDGLLQELVDFKVARATMRLLRENTHAEITCVEVGTASYRDGKITFEQAMTLWPVLREFDVRLADANDAPQKVCAVPGGGSMFRQYTLHSSVADTDAFVSVQKMKNHHFMGVTLCTKNLFGLPPLGPFGRARQYFHHLVRLPYVLADLGRIAQPTLNIVDALVGQARREWGGPGRICDALIAGDQVIATDACAAHLMGHDPASDWPTPPFRLDRNHLRIAAEGGFGTVNLNEIDFQSEVQAPLAEFDSARTDPLKTVKSWRRTTCEQALYYRDNQKKFVDQYAGEFILLQDGEVRWHGPDSENIRVSRRELAGERKDSALWLKLVDPEEAEGEHYEVYEQTLAKLKDMK
jgi:hypothetical protein